MWKRIHHIEMRIDRVLKACGLLEERAMAFKTNRNY